jgi:hypothetical protein
MVRPSKRYQSALRNGHLRLEPAAAQELTGAAIMKDTHPLHSAFKAWCGDKPKTKRKAREFLAKFPNYVAPKAA